MSPNFGLPWCHDAFLAGLEGSNVSNLVHPDFVEFDAFFSHLEDSNVSIFAHPDFVENLRFIDSSKIGLSCKIKNVKNYRPKISSIKYI